MEGGVVDLSNGSSAEFTGTVRDEKGPAAVPVNVARPEITTTTSNSVFSTDTA